MTLEQERLNLPQLAEPIRQLLIDPRHMWLYAISGKASADVFDLRRKQLNGRYKLVGDGSEITSVSPLLGGISLMVGDSRGSIGQWFMVRAADGQAELKNVRNFKLGSSPVRQILPEERRKGFLALDDSGSVGIFHSTAHRTLLKEQVADGAALAAMSPRATRLLLESAQGCSACHRQPAPGDFLERAVGKVWYESYPEPDYVWQSTSANSDFEPLSLRRWPSARSRQPSTPCCWRPCWPSARRSIPYFMAPSLRRKVKPVIELMEALPTVILGFFAGLFLAPFLENHLPGIFALLLLMPVGILFAAGPGAACRKACAWRSRKAGKRCC